MRATVKPRAATGIEAMNWRGELRMAIRSSGYRVREQKYALGGVYAGQCVRLRDTTVAQNKQQPLVNQEDADLTHTQT